MLKPNLLVIGLARSVAWNAIPQSCSAREQQLLGQLYWQSQPLHVQGVQPQPGINSPFIFCCRAGLSSGDYHCSQVTIPWKDCLWCPRHLRDMHLLCLQALQPLSHFTQLSYRISCPWHNQGSAWKPLRAAASLLLAQLFSYKMSWPRFVALSCQNYDLCSGTVWRCEETSFTDLCYHIHEYSRPEVAGTVKMSINRSPGALKSFHKQCWNVLK